MNRNGAQNNNTGHPDIGDYAVIDDSRSIAHLVYGAILGGFYRLAGT